MVRVLNLPAEGARLPNNVPLVYRERVLRAADGRENGKPVCPRLPSCPQTLRRHFAALTASLALVRLLGPEQMHAGSLGDTRRIVGYATHRTDRAAAADRAASGARLGRGQGQCGWGSPRDEHSSARSSPRVGLWVSPRAGIEASRLLSRLAVCLAGP